MFSNTRTTPLNVSHDDFKVAVFKAGYNLLKNQFTLSTAQELNTMVNETSPTSFGEHMDHLAHHLITTEPSRESENALKLALSRILYMVGGTSSHTQQQYFKSRQLDHLLEQALDCKPKLDPNFDDMYHE